MRKRQVADIVAQGSQPQNSAPIRLLLWILNFRKDLSNLISMRLTFHDGVKDLSSQMHDTQRMLQSFVRRTGIYQVRQRELLDTP